MNTLYIPPEDVEAYGESTARSLPVTGTVSSRAAGRGGAAALRSLLASRNRLQKQYASAPMPESARWLLDNWYLAQREGLGAIALLRRGGALRACREGALLPALCRALLVSGGGGADEARCLSFLSGVQKKTILTRRELQLFPAALRCAALSLLAQAYEKDLPDSGLTGALFTSLRLWGTLDLAKMLEEADRTEQILRQDPAGVYPLMDEGSRAAYRRQTEKLARRRGIPEYRAAQRAVRLAREGQTDRQRHVGYYLFVQPLGEPPRIRRGTGYVAANVLATLFFSLLAGFLLESPAAALLLLLPFSRVVKGLLDLFILRFVPPRHLPRLELKDGVPPEGRTLCVLSVLLTGTRAAEAAVRHMEEYRMASRDCGRELLFGLLCDFPESEQAVTHQDRELTAQAAQAVEELNARYGGGFYLLVRDRSWSRDMGRCTGWERKRGAILELARLLHGDKSSLRPAAGDPAGLEGVRYILTLDGDTRLQPESARSLIGAALHPLNRPITDRRLGVVTAGHGVIQPRIGVDLASACRNDFTRLFAGQGGTDPYTGDAGEVYMDLLDSGGFAGKGILDVQAFLECMDERIPEGRVLSHDALEGAFLRGGYLEDTEVTDGFPSSLLSYYRRLHRWTRGDWQNAPWLFRRGRALPGIERWRLFDSLCRSLTPPAILAALLAGFFLPVRAMAWTAGLALLPLFARFVFSLLRGALRREEEVRLRLLSRVLHGAVGELTGALVRFLLLPGEAWVCFSALCTALWRMLISRKNLLCWQTAAQAEQGNGSLGAYYRYLWFSPAVGAASLLLAPSVLGKAVGVLWLLAPACAAALCRTRPERNPIPADDRDWLMGQARAIWRYFEHFCAPADHYLPPDNYQDSPPVGLAHRTSPTNAGLALVSALCALDLGLTGRDRALLLVERLLDTLDRLPKWNGHLYNWYDTRTLRPLEPAYVSTVDSGNLAGCLLVAAAGLREHGALELAGRADALRLAMDFRPLYDSRRDLFCIGLTPGQAAPPKSWYDLLESEERLTGYIAIASGQAPRRHWRRLSRAQVQCNGFRGMASWTGTMFEYLMPELFLPLYRDSLLYESARFALYVQKKRRAPGGVWGTSESAFYALDAALCYRYKAHGCARLALCRGMDEELVISPYSSFLALPLSRKSALANLRALERMGMTGPYGFWEALDCTPARCPEGTGMPVRCVMAHHLGMSLCAITNTLLDDLLPRRFLSDPAMAAYQGLLQEKVPLGGLLLRRRDGRVPVRPRPGAGIRQREGEGLDPLCPACTALSNGVYSLTITESGLSRPRFGTVIPYRAPRSPLGDGQGLALYFLSSAPGQSAVPLLPLPGQPGDYHWRLSPRDAVISGRLEGLDWSVTAFVSRKEAGEVRRVSLRREDCSVPGSVLLQLEPVLLPEKDYVNHPSYSRLGFETRVRDGVLLVRRLPRGSQGELYLALASSPAAVFSSDFRRYPGRGGIGSGMAENTGWQSEPMLTADVTLPVGTAAADVTFGLCAAASPDAAFDGARRILREEGGFPMADAAARLLDMDEDAVNAAMDMIPQLMFPQVCPQGADLPAPAGRDALWQLGISGDLPIVCAECASAGDVTRGGEYLRRHALLAACGVSFDLVFLTDDGGEYQRPRRSALEGFLRKMERDACLGARGGVHFGDLAAHRETLLTAAALYLGNDPVPVPEREPAQACILPWRQMPRRREPAFGWNEDGSFSFTVNASLPARAWGNVLANETLGWLASDAGTGGLWFKNARECPLIPGSGDPLALEGPERLWIERDGQRYSLFASCQDTDCRVTFAPGTAVWEKTAGGLQVRLTAFLPPRGGVRIFLLESSGPCRVFWCAPVRLAPEWEDACACAVTWEDGVFSARNPRCVFPGLTFTALCSQPFEETATDARRWLCGKPGGPLRCGEPCFAGAFAMDGEAVLVCGVDNTEEYLLPGRARQELEETRRWWQARTQALTADTPDEPLNRLIGGWCQYQALACRIMGRSSLYQSGGAVGFRDQLQDRVNLIPLDAAGCRAHILACCAHQFLEGDVQHWWHPGPGSTDKGVRTRCSDDLLWLPWAVCVYTEETGDLSLCREEAAYLSSLPLEDGEESRYETPALAGEAGSVLDHCRRALRLVLHRGVGSHGLLLIGAGDWNDGFDAMGPGAESVWLTWFFSIIAHRFAGLLNRLEEPEGDKYLQAARALGEAADRAWDGDRYLRGYYGDGTPLGGREGRACRVDGIAQSFAALCPYANPHKVRTALDTALRELWDRENHLVKLYDPPFGPGMRSPGYVSGYGPGLRENGGQYTHGAIWLAIACLRHGRQEEGAAILRDACAVARDPAVYGAEPFVIPADVYAGPGLSGRAGWSWYTGSAGWFFRAVFRDLLGFTLRDGKPALEPHLPQAWPGFTGRWRGPDGQEWIFGVENGEKFMNLSSTPPGV